MIARQDKQGNAQYGTENKHFEVRYINVEVTLKPTLSCKSAALQRCLTAGQCQCMRNNTWKDTTTNI